MRDGEERGIMNYLQRLARRVRMRYGRVEEGAKGSSEEHNLHVGRGGVRGRGAGLTSLRELGVWHSCSKSCQCSQIPPNLK